MLGPVLFLVFINDLDSNIFSKILKFADDAKLVQRVYNVEGRDKLREDLSSLFKWSEEWQMNFNLDKCKIMHIGNKNKLFDEYAIGGHMLEKVEEEKDLGVIINDKFKVDKQIFHLAQPSGKFAPEMKVFFFSLFRAEIWCRCCPRGSELGTWG